MNANNIFGKDIMNGMKNFYVFDGNKDLEECIMLLHKILFEKYMRIKKEELCNANKQLEADIGKQLKLFYIKDINEERVIYRFMNSLLKVKELVESDVAIAYASDPAASSYLEIVLTYPGVFATMVQRVAHLLHTMDIPIFPRMLTEYAHSRTGIDIHPGACIGRAFFIDHGTGIVIGETTIIGNNVKIYQGVTLGALSTRGGQRLKALKRHPTVEDDVTIYAGATILGGETIIEKGAVIGGNAWITNSVQRGIKVVSSLVKD